MDVSTRLTVSLKPPQGIVNFVLGKSESYFPKTQNEYKTYRKFMHDSLCLFIVDSMGFAYEGNLDIDSKLVKSMTPDLVKIDKDTIKIIEVTITENPRLSRERKRAKYQDYVGEIRSKGLKVDFDVIALDYQDVSWFDQDPFPSILKEEEVFELERLIVNLINFHCTEVGSRYRKGYFPDVDNRSLFDNPRISGLEALDELLSNLKLEKSEAVSKLIGEDFFVDPSITKEDNHFINELAKIAETSHLSRPSPFTKEPGPGVSFTSQSKIFEHVMNKRSNCDEKSVYPYPVPRIVEKEVKKQSDYLDDFKSISFHTALTASILDSLELDHEIYGPPEDLDELIEDLADEDLTEQGILNSTKHKVYKIKRSDQLTDYLLQCGVGRKKAESSSKTRERDAPTSVKISANQEANIGSLRQKLDESFKNMDSSLLELNTLDSKVSGMAASTILNEINRNYSSSSICKLLEFEEVISREIILNGCRRRRSNEVIITHSGFKDLYLCLLPGAQLRTGSGTMFVVFIDISGSSFLQHPWLKGTDASSKTKSVSQVCISVDLDRLNWLIRVRDKVVMTHFSQMSSVHPKIQPDKAKGQKSNSGSSIFSFIKEEISSSDSFDVIAAIFSENRMVTSQFVQLTRYYFMKSIGDQHFRKLWAKMPNRVCSSLHSLLLFRFLKSIGMITSRRPSDWITMKPLVLNEFKSIDEDSGGVHGQLPRLFSKGGSMPVDFQLNEIYYCMFYEKDRQNKVLDQMGILDKIASEEQKMVKELESRDGTDKTDHLFGIHSIESDLQHARKQDSKKESHYFSMRAATIASKLQRVDKSNRTPKGQWFTKSKMIDILDQRLEKFATFKASVIDICRNLSELLDEPNMGLGNRTKCIDNVLRLMTDEKIFTVKDLINSIESDFEILIQIFKKNQIGGVREIIILEIKSRILINIIEEISRHVARGDSRELLTKGKDKKLLLKEDFRTIMSEKRKDEEIQFYYNSYDCKTWCQKFIPTIFLAIYRTEEQLTPLKDLIQFTLMKHTQKKIEFPIELVKQWLKYPEKAHKSKAMQSYKEKFLKDRVPFMTNISNMCQGILHYNSTVLACLKLSLRDAIFEKALENRMQEKRIYFKSRVGSDDHGDMIGIIKGDKTSIDQVRLLDRCLAVSENLLSISLSEKSAANFFVYEVNQCYLFNGDLINPEVKFAHSAVSTFETDSFTGFVNQSYSSIRQLKENGSTSLVCQYAHLLNKKYAEEVFRTGVGSTNDPRLLLEEEDENNIPYDYGIYPLFDCNLHELAGPELYNYMILKRLGKTDLLRSIYGESDVFISPETLDENMPAGIYKRSLPRISRGTNRLLIKMQETHGVDPEELESYFSTRLSSLIGRSTNIEDSINKIKLTLLTPGADKSLRRTSPGVSYCRIGAFASATAWRNSNGDYVKYSTLIKEIYNRTKSVDFNIEVAFPQHQRFEVMLRFLGSFGSFDRNRTKTIRASRRLALNNSVFRFTSPYEKIITSIWDVTDQLSVPELDIIKLKSLTNLLKDCETETTLECKKRGIKPTTLMNTLRRYYNMINKEHMEAFVLGNSTTSLSDTIFVLSTWNHIPGMVMNIRMKEIREEVEDMDKGHQTEGSMLNSELDMNPVFLAYNLMIAEKLKMLHKIDGSDSLVGCTGYDIIKKSYYKDVKLERACMVALQSLNASTRMNIVNKRALFFVAAYFGRMDSSWRNLLIDRFLSSGMSSTHWEKKQVFDRETETWTGDFRLIFSYKQETVRLVSAGKSKWIELCGHVNTRDFLTCVQKAFSFIDEPDDLKGWLRDPPNNDQAVLYDGTRFFLDRPSRHNNAKKLEVKTVVMDEMLSAYNSRGLTIGIDEYEDEPEKMDVVVYTSRNSRPLKLIGCSKHFISMSESNYFAFPTGYMVSGVKLIHAIKCNVFSPKGGILSSIPDEVESKIDHYIENYDMSYNHTPQDPVLIKSLLSWSKERRRLEDYDDSGSESEDEGLNPDALDTYAEMARRDVEHEQHERLSQSSSSADGEDPMRGLVFGFTKEKSDFNVESKEPRDWATFFSMDIDFTEDEISFAKKELTMEELIASGAVELDDIPGVQDNYIKKSRKVPHVSLNINYRLLHLRKEILLRVLDSEFVVEMDKGRLAGICYYMIQTSGFYERTRFEVFFKECLNFFVDYLSLETGQSFISTLEKLRRNLRRFNGFPPGLEPIKFFERLRYRLPLMDEQGGDEFDEDIQNDLKW